jgi:hypothetical protein
VDFDENKIMIENNPEMSLEDIMACISQTQKDDEGTKVEDYDAEESSDAACGDLDEKDLEEMKRLVAPILDSNTDTDPEVQDVPEATNEMKEATTTSSDTKQSKGSKTSDEEEKLMEQEAEEALANGVDKENPDTNH